MGNQIFTIGHSNHSTSDFLKLLQANEITAIADVRSQPRTRINPDFSRPLLQKRLSVLGIHYVFLGRELGARSLDDDCYERGKVVYARLAKQPEFQEGLERIAAGSKKYRIALMCAEKEPLECHRCILVSRHLVEREFDVVHILANGANEKHETTMERLIVALGLSKPDMFRSPSEILRLAYEQQEQRIAYQQPEPQEVALVA